MANVKISGFPVPFALPAAATLTGTEEVPMDQVTGGVRTTVAATTAAIAALASGGSLTITDGTHSVTPTTTITFNGATVSGTTPNGIVTISGGNSSAFSQAYFLLGDFDGVPDDPWPAMLPTVYPGNTLTVSNTFTANGGNLSLNNSSGSGQATLSLNSPNTNLITAPGGANVLIINGGNSINFNIGGTGVGVGTQNGILSAGGLNLKSFGAGVVPLTLTPAGTGNCKGLLIALPSTGNTVTDYAWLAQVSGTTTVGKLTGSGALQLPTSPLTTATTQALTGLVGLKTTANNITSNTGLTADTQLQVTFNEAGTYAITGYLAFFEVTLGTGGFQFDLGAGTATVSAINWAADGYVTALVGNPATTSTTTAQSYSTVSTSSTAPSYVNVTGVVTISVAGTFGARVAQVASSANATTVQSGSYLMFTKIG